MQWIAKIEIFHVTITKNYDASFILLKIKRSL